MLKKITSWLVASVLVLSQSVAFGVYTLQPITPTLQPVTPTLQPVWKLAPANLTQFKLPDFNGKNTGSFAISTKPISNKTVIELTDITASNAGKVLNTWTVNSSFNKNFVVRPKGTNYNFLVMKLDKDGLDKSLAKTKFLQQTYQQYKSKYPLWTLSVQTPVLERLPDRLRLKSKVLIKFKTKAELENIKNLYKIDIQNINIKWAKKLINRKGIMNWNISESEIQKSMFKKCMQVSKCYNQLSKLTWKSYKQLRFYLTYKWNLPSFIVDAMEDMMNDENEESTIEETETIDISLLPVDVFSQNNFNLNLEKDPSRVRITLPKINASFVNLQNLILIQQVIIQAEQTPTPSEQLNAVCNQYSWDLKTACLSLAASYLSPSEKTYNKLLINGFTLWNEYSVSYTSKRHKWGRDIYDLELTLSAWYGFGIRIPIEAKVKIKNWVIPVWWDKNFRADITVTTKDASRAEYAQAGIPTSKLFDGKEFVFTVYSYFDTKLDLMEHSVVDYRIDLIALLWQLLWIDWLHSIDYSKDFTPPYLWQNTITLLEKTYSVQLYKKWLWVWWGTLYGDVKFRAYIDWWIKLMAEPMNAKWRTTNSTNSKQLSFTHSPLKFVNLTAISTNDTEDDMIWTYNKYGIILRDFKYIPQLISTINIRWRLHVRRDIRVNDGTKDISTPYYEVYKFTIDLPSLWAHSGVGEENKKLEATDNKLYHKLKKTNPVLDYLSLHGRTLQDLQAGLVNVWNIVVSVDDSANNTDDDADDSANNTDDDADDTTNNTDDDADDSTNNTDDDADDSVIISCKMKPLRVLNWKYKTYVIKVLSKKTTAKLRKIYSKVKMLINTYKHKKYLTKKEKLILNVVLDVKDIMECYWLTWDKEFSEEDILKELLK